MQRIQQLNGYLDLLSFLFYLEHATKLTMVVQAFDDADLASHILQMVHRTGKTSMNSQAALCHRVFASLEALEHIKKACPTKTE